MRVTRKSILSGKENTLELNVTPEQMYRFENRVALGEYIQTIFPHLSAPEREFILSGITPEEWDRVFSGVDE